MTRTLAGAVLVLGGGALAATPPAYPAPAPGLPAYPPAAVVPLYTATYSPPGADADLAAAVRELAAEVKALRADLAAVKAAAPAPAPARAGPDPLAVATRACAGCHAAAAADERGGGFALLTEQGALAALSPRERRRAALRVESGSMPPPDSGRLPPADKAALVESFRK